MLLLAYPVLLFPLSLLSASSGRMDFTAKSEYMGTCGDIPKTTYAEYTMRKLGQTQ